MANILLVDPGEVPRVAMRGLVERGNHRFATVNTEQTAWQFITEHLKVDLVVLDLRLKDGSGLGLIKRLRADSQLKGVPVLVYTAAGTRNDVRTCLEAKVQNFLMKPYDEEVVFKEIGKAEGNPWRESLFEEERSFCQMMGIGTEELHQMLRKVRRKIDAALPALRQWSTEAAGAHGDEPPDLPEEIVTLEEVAEAAGAWGVVEALGALEDCAKEGTEARLPACFESLELAARLIDLHLEPGQPCVGFMSERELGAQEEEKLRLVWLDAPSQGRCPVVDWEQLQPRIEGMKGCPVIESAAASFQMTATGHPSCINPIMDLVARDPGLSAQVLIAVNQANPAADERSRMEDARSAVGQLGEMKLAAMSRGLISVSERTMEVAPAFNWPLYWVYLRTVARVSQIICEQLELFSLEAVARTAAELHDIGTLVLAHLEPVGLQVMIEYARRHRQPLHEVQELFVGSTSAQIGAHFAEHFGLSVRFSKVMRWIDDPEQAGEDARLVAVVALARDVCEHARVGSSGNPVDEDRMFMADRTRAWRVLQDCVFPSFNVREFERLMLSTCRGLKSEFTGKGITRSPLHVA